MSKLVLRLLLKLFTKAKRFFVSKSQFSAKSNTLLKSKTKPMFWSPMLLYISLCISLSSPQLNASETATQTSRRVSSGNDLLPKLISYSPMPCVAAGSSLTIQGSNFDQLDSTQEHFSLAVELEDKRQPIEYQQKSNTIIVTTLPLQFKNIANIRIGLLADKKWRQNSIEIEICSADGLQANISSSQQEPDNSTQNVDRATNEVRGTNQPQAQTEPDLDKPDTGVDNVERNNDLRRRIANRKTEGSLIGSGLPSLPQALRLKQPSNASSYVSDQLIAVSADIDQAKLLAQIMSGYQARAIRRKTLSALGMVLSTFRLAPGNTVNDILKRLRNSNSNIWIDANHLYYPSAKANNKTNKKQNNNRTNLFNTIGLANNQQCNTKVKIGILDGPVQQNIESLAQQTILQKQMFSRGKKPALSSHGTAIASLLVGSAKFPQLTGIMRNAELIVGVVMQAQPNDKKKAFTTTENLILGLNWLVEQQVDVINLSLGGPRNALLEIALSKVLELDIGVVAAAGNSGSKKHKIYPAAQSGVIAVSALDSDANLAEDATQGDYIELSAPGVDLWVASEKSAAHYLSGSSLAAPLVAAALAQLGGSPKQSTLLFKASKDLGKPGKDSKFGWGLLQFPACND